MLSSAFSRSRTALKVKEERYKYAAFKEEKSGIVLHCFSHRPLERKDRFLLLRDFFFAVNSFFALNNGRAGQSDGFECRM